MPTTYMYGKFERFWHWSQAVLIIVLLVTGFEIHGSYQWLGYEKSVELHRASAWIMIGLWALAMFWHLTTGEWKQYKPDRIERILTMVRFYALGIFQGKPHPFNKSAEHKHNPLQRIAYLMLYTLIEPATWVTGLVYLFYRDWNSLTVIPLSLVAMLHTAAAFLMLSFLIVHLYLTLTSDSKPFASLKAMIVGYEDS